MHVRHQRARGAACSRTSTVFEYLSLTVEKMISVYSGFSQKYGKVKPFQYYQPRRRQARPRSIVGPGVPSDVSHKGIFLSLATQNNSCIQNSLVVSPTGNQCTDAHLYRSISINQVFLYFCNDEPCARSDRACAPSAEGADFRVRPCPEAVTGTMHH